MTIPYEHQMVLRDIYFFLAGHLLLKPRKMVLLIKFGFEVDTLEIALREQIDLIDRVFLVESTKTHKGVNKSYDNSVKLKRTEMDPFRLG